MLTVHFLYVNQRSDPVFTYSKLNIEENHFKMIWINIWCVSLNVTGLSGTHLSIFVKAVLACTFPVCQWFMVALSLTPGTLELIIEASLEQKSCSRLWVKADCVSAAASGDTSSHVSDPSHQLQHTKCDRNEVFSAVFTWGDSQQSLTFVFAAAALFMDSVIL